MTTPPEASRLPATLPDTLPSTLTLAAPVTDVILKLHTLTTPPIEWARDGDPWREEIDRTRPIGDDEVVQFRLRWEFYGIVFSIDTARLYGTVQRAGDDQHTTVQLNEVEYPPAFLYLTGAAIAVAALTGLVALINGDFGNVVLALAPMLLLGLAAWGVRNGVKSAVRSRIQKVQLTALEAEAAS